MFAGLLLLLLPPLSSCQFPTPAGAAACNVPTCAQCVMNSNCFLCANQASGPASGTCIYKDTQTVCIRTIPFNGNCNPPTTSTTINRPTPIPTTTMTTTLTRTTTKASTTPPSNTPIASPSSPTPSSGTPRASPSPSPSSPAQPTPPPPSPSSPTPAPPTQSSSTTITTTTAPQLTLPTDPGDTILSTILLVTNAKSTTTPTTTFAEEGAATSVPNTTTTELSTTSEGGAGIVSAPITQAPLAIEFIVIIAVAAVVCVAALVIGIVCFMKRSRASIKNNTTASSNTNTYQHLPPASLSPPVDPTYQRGDERLRAAESVMGSDASTYQEFSLTMSSAGSSQQQNSYLPLYAVDPNDTAAGSQYQFAALHTSGYAGGVGNVSENRNSDISQYSRIHSPQ